MTEREKEIFQFGDLELLKLHAMGGRVPEELQPRVEMLLQQQCKRRPAKLKRHPVLKLATAPHENLPWVPPPRRVRREREKYAIENLIGRRLPARKTA